MQRLIMMIRQYLSSKNSLSERPINSLFDVESSLNEFLALNNTIDGDVSKDELRNLMCREALRSGMVLHFGQTLFLS